MAEQRIGWWTYRRQRLGGAAGDAASALRDVIGVYSAHPSAPLSLLARCASLDAAGFRGLDALRLPAMRGAIHLLPRETAHLAFRALPEPPARGARRLRSFGLTEQSYRPLRSQVLELAATPRTARELRAALGVDRELSGVIGQMTREGVLSRVGAVGLRSNELGYQTCDLPQADGDAALAWLAGEYLRAFGPARRQDFEWWAGVSAARARAALAEHELVDVGDGLLLPADQLQAYGRARRNPARGAVDLLPKWDCLTMGYPLEGRGRFAHADIVSSLYDHRGDGLPVVLLEGAAAGTWGLRAGAGATIEFDAQLFERPAPTARAAIDAAFERVRALLE